MTFAVKTASREWAIIIEPGQVTGEFTVAVDGKPRVMNVAWIDAETLSLIDGAAVHELRIHPRGNGAIGVERGGRLVDVAVAKQDRVPVRGSGAPAPDVASSHTVKSPMPGRVVRLLVAVGDRVAARQGVIVVEAMKMENELRSARDGIVKEIAVSAGATVESGAVLMVISAS